MHNSQGGQPMAYADSVGFGDTGGTKSSAPRNTLLLYSCVGCHTGVNDGTNATPFIYDPTANYSTAAPDSGEGDRKSVV